MKTLLFLALIGTASLAAESPSVVLSYPGAKSAVAKSDVVTVVVDKGVYTVDGTLVPEANLVPYVNGLLRDKPSGLVCVYVRENATLGEVVHSVDQLRTTHATTVALSRSFLGLHQEL